MNKDITYNEVDLAIRSNATPQVKGFLYQFLVALDFCFEMKANETLYIEKFGDFAIKTEDGTGRLSVETKHYEEDIFLLHHNVVNTLYNWSQKSFHQEQYSKLFLITTQNIREGDVLLLIGEKDTDVLYQIITEKMRAEVKRIKESLEKKKKTDPNATLSVDQQKKVHQLEYLSDEVHEKTIKEVFEKWSMNVGCLEYKELYDSIVSRYASMLEGRKSELYIDGLFAMIINPGIVNNCWCINRKDFEERQRMLNADFSARTVSFPTIGEPTSEETQGLGSSLFVEKLRLVKLEEEIVSAIHHYVKTNNLILKEIKGRPVRDQGLEKYKGNLQDLFRTEYNKHTTQFIYDPNQNVFKSSRVFYYAMQNACLQVSLEPFNTVDVFFAQGVLHILADDKSLNVKWEINGTSV